MRRLLTFTAMTLLVSSGPLAGEAGESTFSGRASYYAKNYFGRTASGAVYDAEKFTAAHRTLPFGTKLRVVDTRSGRTVSVVVNDRGPFIRTRVLDLSFAAAKELKMISRGTAMVRAETE